MNFVNWEQQTEKVRRIIEECEKDYTINKTYHGSKGEYIIEGNSPYGVVTYIGMSDTEAEWCYRKLGC